jgi:DNA-binding Xre family transcriptional regulator
MVDLTMPTRWKLKEFLDTHKITVYRLSQATGSGIARNSLYNLVQDEPPKRLEIKTLDVLIPALRQLTGRDVQVDDLLEYTEETGKS